MSAYLVSPEHIAEIARFAYKPNQFGFNPYNLVAKHQIDLDGAADLARLLLQANVDSLQARYYDHGPVAGGFLREEKEVTNYFDKEAAAKAMIKKSTGDVVAWDYEPKREAV